MTKVRQKQNQLGRPRLKIDLNILANLAQIGCPDYEIAKILNISARTLSRNYAEYIDENREKGKASLRKKMWDKALKKDNTMMQIWLSKNYLGFKDKIETHNTTKVSDSYIWNMRDKWLKKNLFSVIKNQKHKKKTEYKNNNSIKRT